MQPTLCTRCHKNVAVVFITRIEGNETKNEGLCLKCARELGIKPVDDMMKKMGISEDDLESISNEMMSAFGGAEGLEGIAPGDDEDDGDDEGRTATFPFLNKLFGAQQSQEGPAPNRGDKPGAPKQEPAKGEKAPKRKFLESYCISLTRKAAEGKLDRL